MTAADTVAVVGLGLAMLVLFSLPPVNRPAGWPSPKQIADRVTLWAVALIVAIILASIRYPLG